MLDLTHLENIVMAIGALGTASFALVDATKIGRNGGISNSGFSFIECAVRQVFPNSSRNSETSEGKLLNILHGIWINGSALADQKAIAKSLIKLQLSPQTAVNFAAATSVDSTVLSEVAKNMTTGVGLTPQQTNALGRFDLALTAILDEGYQRADQKYRNFAKVLASIVSVLLAVLGGWAVAGSNAASYFGTNDVWIAALCGLLAIPLAPISKDLTSALAAGVKVVQAIKQ